MGIGDSMNVSQLALAASPKASLNSNDEPIEKSPSPLASLDSDLSPDGEESLAQVAEEVTKAVPPPLRLNLDQSPGTKEWIYGHRDELRALDASTPKGGSKRDSSRISPHLSSATTPPPTKKLHHYHRSPRRPRSANASRSSGHEQSVSNPLFYSDYHSRRPPLPYRMSSSEAAARMLGKGHKEESGGVKTLKLARGAASNTGSPSRPSGQRTPSGSGRSHFGLHRAKSPPEERYRSSGLNNLTQAGIVELLDQDDRPTFVVDLTEHSLFEPGPLRITFANASLRAVPAVLDRISGAAHLESPGLAVATVFSDFKNWATSFVKDHEPLDVVMPTFTFAGAVWTCSVVRKRFRVFRGVPISPRNNLSPNPPSLGMPSASPLRAETAFLTTGDIAHDADEPQDYFGKMEVPVTSQTQGEKGNIVTAVNAARGLTISKLTQPADLPYPLRSDHDQRPIALAKTGSSANSSQGPLSTPVQPLTVFPSEDIGFFDWTRMADSPALPPHIRFARSIDWASTSLGPIDGWSSELRSMCNLIMASPHPAAMYWGKDFIAIYNEAYIYLAGQKHPELMGQSYKDAWPEIWDKIEGVFDIAVKTGESTMKEDDCLFIQRAQTVGAFEEAWFDWSIIPLVGGDGAVVGLYNPAFEKTKRKVGERRTETLSSIGEKTATAKDLKKFWQCVLQGLETNAYDVPFALLYSVSDEIDSDSQSSAHAGNLPPAKQCVLEGKIGVPDHHPVAAPIIDLRDDSEYLARVFNEAGLGDRPIILSVGKGSLDLSVLEGIEWRGHPEASSSAICCPVQSTRNETLGYLVLGVNPRRPYDDDYSTFVQILSRQISTAMASVVLFEEEIRAGMKAKRRADVARLELSQQLAVQTQATVETERKFTQMARFAPVGIFIANASGAITYRNEKLDEILKAPESRDDSGQWIDAIKEDDKDRFLQIWSDLIHNGVPMSTEVRFKTTWVDKNSNQGDTWVLASGYPDKDEEGKVKAIFGSMTDISQQKWAEHFEKRRMEEAVEMKRQQENFIDITSHEMRNPLSAILQCADEISTSLGNFSANGSPARALPQVTQDAVDAAGIISLCAQHQKRIVDDILTLSKLDSALLLVTPCDSMPRNVVQQALKMFEGEVQTADIKLEFKVDDSIRDLNVEWVKIDPSRVLQVLINLTTNAIKFTTTQKKRLIKVTLAASLERPPRDGMVSYIPLRSKRKDQTNTPDWGDGEEVFLHFAVQDTGRGLSETEKKMLFLRFSQASPRTHVQYGGSGLGLFISRELVELQGGEIGVASKAGEGSTFAFYVKARRSSAPPGGLEEYPTMASRKASGQRLLPVPATSTPKAAAAVSGQSEAAAESKKPANPNALKILVVEDNLVNQKVLARQLRNFGVTVHVANHGGECLDRLRESTFWHENKNGENITNLIRINAILMDQEMPVMDGLTCTRAIREMEKRGEVVGHVPIIAVTANARSEQIETALGAGLVSFMTLLLLDKRGKLIRCGKQDDVVSKPFRILDLIPKVEELVAKYPVP